MSDEDWKFVQYDADFSGPDDDALAAAQVTGVLVDALQQKGFCVLNAKPMVENLGEGGTLMKEAAREATQLEESGRFERPPLQIVQGLLGEDGSGAVCELDAGLDSEDGKGQDGPNLQALEKVLDALTALLVPVSEVKLGLQVGGRSPVMLHLSGEAAEDEDDEPAELREAEAEKWLSHFVNQRLMLLLFLGPGKGHLELKPFRHEDSALYVVSTEPGTAVVLRTDTISQRYYSYDRTVVLTAALAQTRLDEQRVDVSANEELLSPITRELLTWITERMRVLKEAEVAGPHGFQHGVELSREWQSAMNHMYVRGAQCAIRGLACKFPSTWDPYNLFAPVVSGADMAIEVPFMRWKHEDHYNPDFDSWKYFKSYAKHGVFLEGADLFDPKPFGLAVYEAKGMDPCQRHILETAYESLHDGGYTKKTLMRGLIGCYIGAAATEFQYAENCNEGVGTSCAGAITSNRISFCLGMQGPSFTVDLGAAASLGSMSSAVNSIRFQTDLYVANHSAVAGAVNLMLAPQFFVLGCAAGFLSPLGRSCSFDVSANGYVRGEGVGCVAINPLAEMVDGVPVRNDSKPYHGSISSIGMTHSGLSASLTAPSGPQESALISDTVRQASLSPLDVDFVEAWGEAGILSDACSAKAMTDALRSEGGPVVLGASSVMSGTGYMHESLGMAQLFKVVLSSKMGVQAPGIHILELNPHIDVWEGEPVNFLTEAVRHRQPSAFVGLGSKSSSGTLVHTVAWGEVDHRVVLPRKRLTRDAIAFWPGGGGELPDGAEPSRGYSLLGSWGSSQWTTPEPMKLEGDGVYGATVTLGVNRFEHFQILLDGDAERALHPGVPNGAKNLPVQGPDTAVDSEGFAWLIDGREQYLLALARPPAALEDAPKEGGGQEVVAASSADEELQAVLDPQHQPGSPGDKFHVRLHVAGKWRTVDWKRVSSAPALKDGEAPADDGTYYIVASWDDWGFGTAMEPDPSSPGTFFAVVSPPGYGGDFQVVRNKDWHQAFFPAAAGAAGAAEGPEVNAVGASWTLHARRGETFRIELRRAWEDGAASASVTWAPLP